jgi:hypothetical protein
MRIPKLDLSEDNANDALGKEYLAIFEHGIEDYEGEKFDEAETLLCGPLADAFTIALDRLGWMIVIQPQYDNAPSGTPRWRMHKPSLCRPVWADRAWDEEPPPSKSALQVIEGDKKDGPTEP